MRGMADSNMQDLFNCMPEIDYTYGYGYFLNNMENYTKALFAILKSVKAKLPILQNMYRTKEYSGLRMIVQTLGRMLSNVGANDLSEMSYQIEKTIVNRDDILLGLLLWDYIEELIEFADHLEHLLQKLNVPGSVNFKDSKPSFLQYDFTKTKESLRLSTDFIERKII